MERTIITEREAAHRRAVLGSPLEPQADRYADRLLKYIPPDVIAAFTAIEGFVSSATGRDRLVLGWFTFAVILIATPAYLVRFAGVRKPLQVAISTAAFIVWALAYRGPPFEALVPPLWSAVLLALFTFLVPLVPV